MLKDMFGTFFMCSSIRGEDKEVIHINDKPSFSDHVSERVIHESLECDRGVGEAEKHNSRFKEAFVGNESGFPLMPILDADIVVAPSNIKFDEDFSVFEFVDEVGD